jgi:hypothetical protein
VVERARLGTPWEDTDCDERADWRTRAAYADDTDEPVFEIDYRVCRRCGLGWVELPFTLPAYQRRVGRGPCPRGCKGGPV